MNKHIHKIVLILIGFCLNTIAFAQKPQVEMADVFRAEGKIYVVIGVFAIIMLVLFIYLFMMDSKIRKLEKRMDEK